MDSRPLTQIGVWPESRLADRLDTSKIQSPTGEINRVVTLITADNSQKEVIKRKASLEIQNGRRKLPRLPIQIQTELPVKTSSGLLQRYQPVWSLYQKSYEIEYGETLVVAVRKSPPVRLAMVRQTSKTDIAGDLRLLDQLRGKHFVECFDICVSNSSLDIVFEYMDLSLLQILGAPTFPTEKEIAAIAGQLVEGLKVLDNQNLVHGRLTTSSVLINSFGEVKIFQQEVCQTKSPHAQLSHRDVQDLGKIIVQLVTKSTSYGSSCQEPDRRRYSTDLLDFISQTVSATPSSLSDHALFASGWERADLLSLVSLAQKTSHVRYRSLRAE